MKISVVIISYERCDLAVQNVKSLVGAYDFEEVLVLDNSSKKSKIGVYSELNQFDNVKVNLSEQNLGVAKGRNYAFSLLSPVDYVLFIDDDAYLDEYTDILDLCNYMHQKDVGVLASNVYNHYSKQKLHHEFPGPRRLLYTNKEFSPTYFIGTAFIFKFNYFKALGGFGDKFFYGMEELDLSIRYREIYGNTIIYHPLFKIYHMVDVRGRQNSFEKWRGMYTSRVFITKKYFIYPAYIITLLAWSVLILLKTKSFKTVLKINKMALIDNTHQEKYSFMRRLKISINELCSGGRFFW
ncbi:glycosyltransferase family 2 protein [Litoribrevibacter albus]|uniref:Glycosyltransferase 2-like domain-containing protein n=1 Tax=Litoribrevibacter albus TaxID=1473156 RepID=A0AA37W9D3_9GAMM|nr:glycosyltransferase [Litoribrevibacter albus]GLQ33209.1 hypothetical protein GCM10007876_36890 [Litoribrevibacter albus]